MSKTLPNLPIEIINKIVIMRQTHPNADMLKNYIEQWIFFKTYKIPYFISEYNNYECSSEFDKFIFYGYNKWFY